MAHLEDSAQQPQSKLLDYATIAFGLAMVPLLVVVAPRFIFNSWRESTAVSVRTASNEAYFAANRIYDDTDTKRVEDLSETLSERIKQDDWKGVATLLAEFDQSRATLDQVPNRLIDVALDMIREEVSERVYAPTMCNFENYYEVADAATLTRLEDVARAHPDDPYLATLLAQFYIDRGWCARGGGWSHEVTEDGWRELMESFNKAAALLARFDVREIRSSLLARVKFQLMVTEESDIGLERARDAYQDWSDLDIGNPLPHRQFAFFALPRWFGDWDSFDVEARNAAKRTSSATGNAAYAQFYLEAFSYDEDDALINIDVDLFSKGVHDLIRFDANPVTRAQRLVVLLKTYVDVEPVTIIGEVFSYFRQKTRAALKPLVRDILETHVTHLATKEGSGFEAAVLAAISDAFQPELKAGLRVSFTPDGVRMVEKDQQGLH